MPRVVRFYSPLNAYLNESRTLGWLDGASQAYAFSIWVYPTAQSGVIIDELPPGGASNDAFLSLVGGNLMVNYLGGAACRSLGAIPLDAWSNVVFTFDGAQTITGWVNGVQTLNPTLNGARTPPGGAADYVLGGGNPGTNCGTGAYYSGMMSDYQVYNSALSNAQVQQLYLNDSVVSMPANFIMPLSAPHQGNLNTTQELVHDNFGIFYVNGVQCTVANALSGTCIGYVAP